MACSSDDVTCAIRALTAAVENLQTSGPSDLDLVGIVLTAVNVAASIVIGVAALVTSRRAVKISDAQRRASYDAAIDDALAHFVESAGDYMTSVEQWRHEIAVLGRQPHQMVMGGGTPMPQAPSTRPMTAAFLASRMRARGDEKAMLDTLAEWMGQLLRLKADLVPAPLNELTALLLEWRAGAAPQKDAIERALKGIAKTKAILEPIDTRVTVEPGSGTVSSGS